MDSVKVVPADDANPIPIPEEAVNSMETIKNTAVISEGNIKIPVKKAIFEKVLEFLKLNGYKEVKTPTVITNDLKTNLQGDDKNYQFLESFKKDLNKPYSSDLAELFKAASYLQCKTLMHLIGLYIATIIYFDDTSESYTKAKDRLGIKTDITVEDEEKYAKHYR